jgi:dimethylaniline monooxygenase (N-oxide forming)
MSKRIFIIGAGASGATAVKACLEEGLTPIVFERSNYTGGLWRYHDDDTNGIASVMKSTIINSSKEMTSFSDFPPPSEFPNYMHNTNMVHYIDMYGQSFGFNEFVHFEHQVIAVSKADDYQQTGRWKVRVKDVSKSPPEESEDVYDGVMVCSGHHVTPNQPILVGQEKFKGKIIHTHSLKKANGFEDKNVVVLGVGNSGGDAAVELSSVAKMVSQLRSIES